jgi:hypothetical protein
MKRVAVTISLVVTLLGSFGAFALECTQIDYAGTSNILAFKLVELDNDLVQATLSGSELNHVFAGKKKLELLGDKTYQLYDQDGKEATFISSKSLVPGHPGSCRARYCGPSTPFEVHSGKLMIAGQANEYFNCL